MCLHEPTAYTDSFEELAALWRPHLGISVGVSDSVLVFQLERILEEIKPRTLLIERPLDEIIYSMRRFLDGMSIIVDYKAGMQLLKDWALELDKFRGHPLVKTVEFSALTDHELVNDLLTWLVPDTEFVDLKSLMKMNIQVTKAYVQEQASSPHAHWYLEKWKTSRKLPAE